MSDENVDYEVGTKIMYRPQRLGAKFVEVEVIERCPSYYRTVLIRFSSGQVRAVLRWRLKPICSDDKPRD